MTPPPDDPSLRGRDIDPDSPTADLLLWAYRRGVFPMADPLTGQMDWYSPDPRGIIPLEEFHVPDTLVRIIRRAAFQIRSDSAFEQVMRECSRPRPGEALSWIDDRLIAAYVALHERAHAHSVEAWREGRLVGGLYGVHIGGAFFGESMFVRPEQGGTNASKVCLVRLVEHLRRRGFALLDTQFTNPHLEQFGCVEIPREMYLRQLAEAVDVAVSWGEFEGMPR